MIQSALKKKIKSNLFYDLHIAINMSAAGNPNPKA